MACVQLPVFDGQEGIKRQFGAQVADGYSGGLRGKTSRPACREQPGQALARQAVLIRRDG